SYADRLEYWLTDASPATLENLASQPVFAEKIQSGQLRLWRIDALNPAAAQALDGTVLKAGQPLFRAIIANYLYCTLPVAMLLYKEGQYWELLSELFEIQPDPADKTDRVSISQKQLEEVFSFRGIDPQSYFSVDSLSVLQALLAEIPGAIFSFPLAAMESLTCLLDLLLPAGQLLLSDKGLSSAESLAGNILEKASLHGDSLAHKVNFPVLEGWFRQQGYDCAWTRGERAPLQTMLVQRRMPAAVNQAFGQHFVSSNLNLESQSLCESGTGYFRQGQIDQAIACWLEALKVRPRDALLIYRLAAAWLQLGQPGEALKLRERAHDGYYMLDEFAHLWAKACCQSGDFAE
ncbi:MAG TPA: tetratricopeptide repeat protein, partial [Candidatus Obscuribacterales bacterium]